MEKVKLKIGKCKFNHGIHQTNWKEDQVAVEKPLRILIQNEEFAVIMRTPGRDLYLVLGLLYSEGIIQSYSDIQSARPCELFEDVFLVNLEVKAFQDFERKEQKKNLISNSSCGLCGSTNIEFIDSSSTSLNSDPLKIAAERIQDMNLAFNRHQVGFSLTGGLHGAGLFSPQGELKFIAEDIGRHNAVDKIVGHALHEGRLPFSSSVLFLSGRVSYELMQKAIRSRIQLVCAIGAPSSLAIELGEKHEVGLIGFVKKREFNIYCGDNLIGE
ncbi:MAG: formate dehydrogenase accessory sulfurtransferase FdhD [Bdellovibrionales bacterium]|nr:formate dehydrogenase accessory sulfurtransferase FdhD [Bdellovibrionales bacterium]